MYFSYFGLTKSPFEHASPFQTFFINDAYREAFVALRYGIQLRLGLVVLTGESGVGKTSLITLFQNSAKKNVRLVVLSARERSAGLLSCILAGLGLDAPAERRRAGIQSLKKYLLEQSNAGQIVAIVIDDADELSLEDFAEIKILLSLRSDRTHLLQIVLAGSPALASPGGPVLRSLRQRVRVWSQIPPLASHEVEAYIEHKLSSAGSVLRGLFQAGAVARIAAYSHGIPGTIDALRERSLRLAYLRSQEPITEPIVENAWKVLQGGSEPDIEAHLCSGDLQSRSDSEPDQEVPKTSPGAITESYVARDTRFTRNSTQGDVRFFFAGDRRAAERVKSVVEAELQTRGYSRRLQLLERDGRKFRFAAPGKIEVWLPPLTQSDPK